MLHIKVKIAWSYIYHILRIKWLVSWIMRMLHGYFPWTRLPDPKYKVDEAVEYISKHAWSPDRPFDWVQHPMQFDVGMKGDCDDFAAWWLSVGRYGMRYNDVTIHPIGMFVVIWDKSGHAVAVFRDDSSRLYIFSNKTVIEIDESIRIVGDVCRMHNVILGELSKVVAPTCYSGLLLFCMYEDDSLWNICTIGTTTVDGV